MDMKKRSKWGKRNFASQLNSLFSRRSFDWVKTENDPVTGVAQAQRSGKLNGISRSAAAGRLELC